MMVDVTSHNHRPAAVVDCRDGMVDRPYDCLLVESPTTAENERERDISPIIDEPQTLMLAMGR